ncbi:MAG: hypothetical protein AAGE98_20135 [Actinomycetota bacterium]
MFRLIQATTDDAPPVLEGTDATLLMWGLIGLCVLVFVWTVPSLAKNRGRTPAIEKAAGHAGMRFQEQDGPGLGRIRFQMLTPTSGLNWNAFNVVTSERRGSPAHAFDIRVWTEVEVVEQEDRRWTALAGEGSGRTKIVRQTRGKSASGCVVRLPINAPRVMIVQENVASKLLATATRVDLDVESDLFNRTYHVITTDRRFAQALLDARVLDLIVQGEGRMEYEFFGNHLLIRTPTLEPELLPGLASYGERFPDVISSLVRDRWRDASALES